MFKNKKIKKLFSVVCTVLTLNFTSSIFQHNPSAIKFETTKGEGDWESTSVTLDKPFYCIVVYDKTKITYQGRKTTWNNIPLADLLFDGADVHGPYEVTTLHVSAKEYINNMQKFLKEVSDEDELLIVVCLTDQNDLCNIPPLPYSFMATPQLKSSDVMQALKKQLNEQTFHHLVFPDNERKKLITLETTIFDGSDDLIREYTLTQDEKFSRTYTPEDNQTEPRNKLWHLRETERIITVQKLKSWIGQNTPGKINNSDLTNKKATPIVTGFVDASEQRTNVFSTTKNFIQKHPIKSVGLGAAIVALVGTIIYKIQKLFTRESPKSQIKHQVHHVKNKI